MKWKFFCFLVMAAYSVVFSTQIKAQPTEPILRLNLPMHTTTINRISIDKNGKYLLTVSFDKTARLWDAQTGNMIRVFRVPIDLGDDGMLYAGAISPNAKFIAVAGWTCWNWDNKASIYFFDVQTGEMIKRISGLPMRIADLEFSPDGNYLAAALIKNNGIRIYKINYYSYPKLSISLYKELSGYGDRCDNIAFSQDGRLATVCFDGYIRLYNSDFSLKRQIKGIGSHPFSIAFSPDGTKLAIGYEDIARVEVRDAKNLSLLYKPYLGGITEAGAFFTITFSADGQYLFGVGIYSKKIDGQWWYVIRRWDNAGKGAYTDFKACDNTVMDIKAFDKYVFYGGGYPDFGKMTNSGSSVFYKKAPTNDLRANDRSHLLIDYSGEYVGFTPFGEEPLSFDVRNLTITQAKASGLPYKDDYQGIRITNWLNTYSPQLNGKNLNFLENYEYCYSVDISDNGQRIVFGTNWNIYCLDKNGEKKWKTATQADVFAVNISENNKVVLAAMGDGALRWYRMSDGKLLMSLFVHKDGKRWILFTPEGYYAASPGAEDFAGWHINQGKDKAPLFYPLSRFRGQYYRPDVIRKVLETYDVAEAVHLANQTANRKQAQDIEQMLPPTVQILSPAYGQEVSTTSLEIRYKAVSPGGEPILGTKILIDGRPVRAFTPVHTGSDTETATETISIPEQDVTISVLAKNKHGWSEPATVSIKWKGNKQTTTPDYLKPTLYVLAIGVSDYQNDAYDLGLPAKDAQDFTNFWLSQKGGLYKDVVVKTLTNSQATKDNILDALDWIMHETTSRDVAMIFVAGHGINDDLGTYYFCPYDIDVNSLRRTGIKFDEFQYTIQGIAGKVLFYIDACHSGNVWGNGQATRAIDMNGLVNELTSAETGAIVYTSSTGSQYSYEDISWGNGAFTKAMLEGLSGKADYSGDGAISVKELDVYIATRVKQLTKGKQAPTTIVPQSIPDFPIAVKK